METEEIECTQIPETQVILNVKNEPEAVDTEQVMVKLEPELLYNIETCYVQQEDNFTVLETCYIKQEDNLALLPAGENDEFQFDGTRNNLDTIPTENESQEEPETFSTFSKNAKSGNNSVSNKRNKSKKQKKPPGRKRKLGMNENEKPYACTKCNYKTKFECRLKSHYLVHDKNNAKWFYCNSCDFRTIRKGDLTRHQSIHTKVNAMPCKYCDKTFTRKSALDSHLLNIHKQELNVSEIITSKVHQCPKCSYRAVHLSSYKVHIMLYHKEMSTDLPKFNCEQCDYNTNRKSDWRTHLFTHSKIKPFICAVCDKRFVRKEEIDSHIVYNHPNNEELTATITRKIHECELCNFRCISSSNFKRHMRRKHTPEFIGTIIP